MNEKKLIQIIKKSLDSEYIGDDCAYLSDLGIVITQDSLVEDVHFSLEYTDAYKLGYKAAMVNLSDIAASGAEPCYMTVSLSLPNNITENFVENFYNGLKDANSSIKIVGGDITGSDKIFISITAIGKTEGKTISKRSNAKIGQKIVVSGFHGSSGAGLELLKKGINEGKFVNAHLLPKAKLEFSKYISKNITSDYAMMDTSDGLMDALIQISEQSNVMLSIDFNKIPYDNKLMGFENFKDLIFYGGEDYELVACVDKDFDIPHSYTIGEVKPGFGVEIDGETIKNSQEKLYNHFKE